MRNVLIHGCIKTNWLTVWNTATTEMESLEAKLKDMQAAFPWPPGVAGPGRDALRLSRLRAIVLAA